jgi:hypothetical protein
MRQFEPRSKISRMTQDLLHKKLEAIITLIASGFDEKDEKDGFEKGGSKIG